MPKKGILLPLRLHRWTPLLKTNQILCYNYNIQIIKSQYTERQRLWFLILLSKIGNSLNNISQKTADNKKHSALAFFSWQLPYRGIYYSDPEVRYSQGDNATAIARFTLAVDRRIKRDNEASADYINCVSFGRSAEFAEKYFHKGTKIVIAGRIQTGSYTNKDGQKVYTTDIVIEEQDFAESKAASQQNNSGNTQNASTSSQAQQTKPQASPDGFMSADDDGLPFH